MARRGGIGILALGAALVALAAVGRAEEGDGAPAGRTLTADGLVAFLAEAGYPSTPQGGGLHRVEVPRDGVTYFCDVSVSSGGQYVWLTAPLDALPAERPLPRQRLLDLLRANAAEGGYQFHLVGDRLVLARALDNRALEAHLVSLEIRRFVEAARVGAPLWNVRGWAAPAGGR